MSFTDKIRNKVDELKGETKEKAGDATDNPRLQAEGSAEATAARGRQAGEHVKDAARDVSDAIRGHR
ncbi:CsbD family protein [Catenuloplanes indicus]|uniref:Uncharacterized protein YjbJ (UPF0337 family) n=1 Tax=Catenuloplanes indicus TaxID=137267 RepID=A0AAE3VTM9_9ACTN|nr:CsbD family protein [Catenuloplanes indicus]MDQ0363459.1 uncharacterized protein YjbJ (UPF0337 family) [Catenuloplanes indicus]